MTIPAKPFKPGFTPVATRVPTETSLAPHLPLRLRTPRSWVIGMLVGRTLILGPVEGTRTLTVAATTEIRRARARYKWNIPTNDL